MGDKHFCGCFRAPALPLPLPAGFSLITLITFTRGIVRVGDPPARGGRREEEGPEDPSTSSSLGSACFSLIMVGTIFVCLTVCRNLACELGAGAIEIGRAK